MMYLMTLEGFAERECVDVPFGSRPPPRHSQMTLEHTAWQGLTAAVLPRSKDRG